MYELLVKTHFDAAHALRNYPGKCKDLHGHTWKVEVSVSGDKLNEIELLMDFADLKKIVDAVLERFDHKYINEISPFDQLSPTGENLASYLFEEIKKKLPPGISLKQVSVWESKSACITYKP